MAAIESIFSFGLFSTDNFREDSLFAEINLILLHFRVDISQSVPIKNHRDFFRNDMAEQIDSDDKSSVFQKTKVLRKNKNKVYSYI